MRHFLPTVLFATLFAVSSTLFFQPALANDELQSAIDQPHRSQANKNRDSARHPKQTLEFFGITPTMTVVELSPGAGWYTEILAPYLKEHGQLIVALQDPNSKSEYARNTAAKFQKKLDANPELYDKVKVMVFEPPEKITMAPDNSVDMVLTFRNVHNWIKNSSGSDDNMKLLFKNIYASLKPGGVFGVVEHRLPATKAADRTGATGYVAEDHVIQLAQSVGFKLAAKSEINANPKDTADHPGGVWALPPSYVNKDANRQQYADIGESDRMTLKFVK